MEKKLYRITEGRMIAGVCGGVAEYLGVDKTVVRVVWAILALVWGAGALAYLLCALLIPVKPC